MFITKKEKILLKELRVKEDKQREYDYDVKLLITIAATDAVISRIDSPLDDYYNYLRNEHLESLFKDLKDNEGVMTHSDYYVKCLFKEFYKVRLKELKGE